MAYLFSCMICGGVVAVVGELSSTFLGADFSSQVGQVSSREPLVPYCLCGIPL